MRKEPHFIFSWPSFPNSTVYNLFIELRSCSRLQAPANGTLHGTDTSHGAKANFSCLTGFDLFGLSTLTCNEGVWSANIPSCKGESLTSVLSCYLCFPSLLERLLTLTFRSSFIHSLFSFLNFSMVFSLLLED